MDWLSELAPQIQFQWNRTSVVPSHSGCNGLVHPNLVQNARKRIFLLLDPSYSKAHNSIIELDQIE
jgi:hypothetical protein